MSDNGMIIKKTSCGICASGCPIDAYVRDGQIISVEGARNYPGQPGSLCSKGAASKQYVYNKDRILYPMRRAGEKGSGKFKRITWEEAYQIIADNLGEIKEQYGAKSVLFYSGYPKWYRPALLRLSNGFGSPNYCTESSTCFQAAAIAWRSIYGNQICRPDIKNTKTLMLWSSNLYHSNVKMGKTYQELKGRGVKVISIDPRKTVTAREADIHLQVIPGTDGALALSMAWVIIQEDLYDHQFVEKYVHGFEEYKAYVLEFPPKRVAKITGIKERDIYEAARTFAGNGPASMMFSASAVVHNINGVQNQRAIFALIALTGNYDIPGGNRVAAAPFAVWNEYGKVARYKKEEAIGEADFPAWFDLSGEEAQCTRLADYIGGENPYPVKAIHAMGLNHQMWPQPKKLNEALKKLDFYVNIELFMSDSSIYADLILPAATSFEREEIKAEPGGRFYLSQKAIAPRGECKNDIEIIMETAKALGVKDQILALGYEKYMEHLLAPSGLTVQELRRHPCGMKAEKVYQPKERTYEGRPFQTPSGKIELKSEILEKYQESHGYSGIPVYEDYRDTTEIDRAEFPLILNTGSRKPQLFHSRLYRIPWLSNLEDTNLIDIHPDDGKQYGIQDKEWITVVTPVGRIFGRACYQPINRPGVVHMYHGNKAGDANQLVDSGYLDPISGFPGYKSYFCKIVKGKEDKV